MTGYVVATSSHSVSLLLLDKNDVTNSFNRAESWAVTHMLHGAGLPYVIVSHDPHLKYAIELYDEHAPY